VPVPEFVARLLETEIGDRDGCALDDLDAVATAFDAAADNPDAGRCYQPRESPLNSVADPGFEPGVGVSRRIYSPQHGLSSGVATCLRGLWSAVMVSERALAYPDVARELMQRRDRCLEVPAALIPRGAPEVPRLRRGPSTWNQSRTIFPSQSLWVDPRLGSVAGECGGALRDEGIYGLPMVIRMLRHGL
jgi:hypothetical protein